MTTTILVVDDEPRIRVMLQEVLRAQGFRVVLARNGDDALLVAGREQPNLILLDIMMPELDGYQFLMRYRREHNTPVIIMTAKEEESDAVIGFELGADDYVIKPFRMREFVARIHAVLRRTSRKDERRDRLEVGDIVLDIKSRTITMRGRPINLTPTEFNLLAILMKSPDQAVSLQTLFEYLVDKGYTGLERSIKVHVRNLRKKIEANPSQPTYIETVFGVGYRFCRPTQ